MKDTKLNSNKIKEEDINLAKKARAMTEEFYATINDIKDIVGTISDQVDNQILDLTAYTQAIKDIKDDHHKGLTNQEIKDLRDKKIAEKNHDVNSTQNILDDFAKQLAFLNSKQG